MTFRRRYAARPSRRQHRRPIGTAQRPSQLVGTGWIHPRHGGEAGRKNITVLGGGGMKQIVKGIMDGSNDMVDADVLCHPFGKP